VPNRGYGVAFGVPGGDASVEVVGRGGVPAAEADDDDAPQGGVGLSVTGAVEAVPVGAPG
jgi:hypothetical protein